MTRRGNSRCLSSALALAALRGNPQGEAPPSAPGRPELEDGAQREARQVDVIAAISRRGRENGRGPVIDRGMPAGWSDGRFAEARKPRRSARGEGGKGRALARGAAGGGRRVDPSSASRARVTEIREARGRRAPRRAGRDNERAAVSLGPARPASFERRASARGGKQWLAPPKSGAEARDRSRD
ncbi:hypothetical protein KM043_012301 [Ampulex compressa]|nr:hypothetical protein KM043_012301 [Ampulex compressa]